MKIDCYGDCADGAERMTGIAREPNGTKRIGGATYLRFAARSPAPIHRLLVDAARSPAPIHRLLVDADGIVRREWAWGMWADAKSLAYVPFDETLEVQE